MTRDRRGARAPARRSSATSRNTLVTYDAARATATLGGVVFYELLRLQRARSRQRSVAQAQLGEIAALTPTERLRAASRRTRRIRCRRRCSARSRRARRASRRAVQRPPRRSRAEEIEFLRTGRGAWRDAARGSSASGTRVAAAGRAARWSISTTSGFLDAAAARGPRRADRPTRIWRGSPRAARRSSPVRAATATPAPARRRSSASTRSGVRVAIGTDSLASVAGSERVRRAGGDARAGAATCRRARLLESATLHGAAALGFDADYGTIEPGQARAA